MKDSDTKGHVLYNSVCVDIQSRQRHRGRKPTVGVGAGAAMASGQRVSFWGDEMFWNWMVGVDAQRADCTKL